MADSSQGTSPPNPAEEATLPPPAPLGETVLLDAQPVADDFPTLSPNQAPDSSAPAVSVPGYEILQELGRGGMGVVYKARQVKLNRIVALKMILSGEHASAAELARFRAEAEAIARLQHPHIVQVFEIGEHDGRPFFSLEFCGGGSLDARLRETPMPPRQAARLIHTLAGALDAAHAANVIHRDLKPANVLLTDAPVGNALGGVPEGSGTPPRAFPTDVVPKITDFSLAKKLDEAGTTQSGAIMGTPSYMAPEQAEGRKVGPAVDVYALGAILYDCLTGRPPFRAATAFDTILQVVSEEPAPPRQLNAKVPRDLEIICLKCLHKEPARRYSSAARLARDLERFLAGEPIRARSAGLADRTFKWVRRRPALASLVATIVIALSLLAAGAVFFVIEQDEARRAAEESAFRESQARQRAERERIRAESEKARAQQEKARAEQETERAEWALQVNRLGQAQRDSELKDYDRAVKTLELCAVRHRGWEWGYLKRGCPPAPASCTGHIGEVLAVDFTPDGRRLVTGGADRTVRLWDARTGKPIRSLRHTSAVLGVAVDPTGRQIVAAASDGAVKFWNLESGEEEDFIQAHKDALTAFALGPDGRLVLTGGGKGELKVWDARTRSKRRTFSRLGDAVHAACFSPNGSTLAAVCYKEGAGSEVRLWSTATWSDRTLARSLTTIDDLEFSPDGRRLAWCSGEKAVIADALTGRAVQTLAGVYNAVTTFRWSPDGTRLAVAEKDMRPGLWQASGKGEKLLNLPGVSGRVARYAFSPNGQHLAVVGGNPALPTAPGEVKILDLRDDLDRIDFFRLASLSGSSGPLRVCFSPDSRLLVVANRQDSGALTAFESATGREQYSRPSQGIQAAAVAFRKEGSLARGDGNLLQILDGPTGVERKSWRLSGTVTALCFSPEGALLACGEQAEGKPRKVHQVSLYDAQTGALKSTFPLTGQVTHLSFTPDGARLAISTSNGHLLVRDVRTGAELLHKRGAYCTIFSPDGARLAGANSRLGGAAVVLWDARSGEELLRLPKKGESALAEPIQAVCFSPNGRRLVSAGGHAIGGGDSKVRLWDVASGMELLSLPAPPGPIFDAAFSPDGKRIALVGQRRDRKTVEEVILMFDARPFQDGARRVAAAEQLVHRQQAEDAQRDGNWFAAAFHLRRLALLSKDEAPVLARLGRAEMALGQTHHAKTHLDGAVTLDPHSKQARLWHARACLADGDEEGYRRSCAALVEAVGPADSAFRAAVVMTLVLRPDASPALVRLAEALPPNAEGLTLRGAALVRAGRAKEAVEPLKQAIDRADGRREALAELFLALALAPDDQHKARAWRDRALGWLDAPRLAGQAVGLMGGGRSGLWSLPALLVEPVDPRAELLGWEKWQELQVLKSEVQKTIR